MLQHADDIGAGIGQDFPYDEALDSRGLNHRIVIVRIDLG